MKSIQVVILCGGSGTRLREETEFKPKPLVHIGGKPMIYHIMKVYDHYGFHNFVLALGYKQEMFKEYFNNFNLINYDTIRDRNGNLHYLYDPRHRERWQVTMMDTGAKTLKGGRLKRIEKVIKEDTFMMTYGDGIADIDLKLLLEFHKAHGKMVTVTGVHSPPRFGEIHSDTLGKVTAYSEKPHDEGCLINGGFYVMNQGIFDYLTADEWCDLERGPLELLAAKGELMVYHHRGAWFCMDTIRDVDVLNQVCDSGKAPWEIWK